jgi:hypothetical protein
VPLLPEELRIPLLLISGRHSPHLKIILRWNAESVCDPIEKCEHRSDVNRLGDLVFFPAEISKLLNIISSGAISGIGDDLDVIQQSALRRVEAGFVQLAFENCGYALIGGSLDTQEVSVTV